MPHLRLARVALIALALLAALLPQRSPARSQDVFHLLKDMNPTPQADTNDVGDMVAQGDFVYFLKDDGTRSTQLWRIDAQSQAELIIDMPKSLYSYVDQLAATDDKIYFLAETASTGIELWVSDGTAKHTHIVADLTSGEESSFDTSYEFAHDTKGNILYFTTAPTPDNPNFTYLWSTDGTSEGTQLISSNIYNTIQEIRSIDDTIYLQTFNAELWVSDGTNKGTTPLLDINNIVSTDYDINDMFIEYHGKTVTFATNTYNYTVDMWNIGKDANSTSIITKIPIGLTYDRVIPALLNDKLYFIITGDSNTSELWQTDGTAAGTTRVVQFSNSYIQHLYTVNNKLLYISTNYEEYTLWASDGTADGAIKIADQISSGYPFSLIGNYAIICGPVVWTTDGTAAGTIVLSNTTDATWCSGTTKLGNELIAKASKAASGKPLWKTNGTLSGTQAISITQPSTAGSTANSAIQISDTTYIATKNQIWKTDGTEKGTIEQTAISNLFPQNTTLGPLMPLKNNFIIPSTPNYTTDLWHSNGTAKGTNLFSSNVELRGIAPIVTTDKVFFVHSEMYLFASDGTSAESNLVYSWTDHIQSIASWGDRALIFVKLPYNSVELWQSDGTTSGTIQLNSFTSFIDTGASLLVDGDSAYTFDPLLNDGMLCQYDKVSTTPNCIRDFNVGYYIQSASIHLFDDQLLININTEAGTQVWQSDGTKSGTHQLFSIPESSTAIVAGSRLFFISSSASGSKLWASSGRTATLLKEFPPADAIIEPSLLTGINGALYFTAYTPATGTELWRSDGTAEGTALYADINPGPASSTPSLLLAQGGSMLVQATTATYGSEPYVIDTPAVAPTPDGITHIYLPLAQR